MSKPRTTEREYYRKWPHAVNRPRYKAEKALRRIRAARTLLDNSGPPSDVTADAGLKRLRRETAARLDAAEKCAQAYAAALDGEARDAERGGAREVDVRNLREIKVVSGSGSAGVRSVLVDSQGTLYNVPWDSALARAVRANAD